MHRLEANLKILEELKEYFTQHPYMRFCQGLWDLDVIKPNSDNFNQESTKTLELIKNGRNLH